MKAMPKRALLVIILMCCLPLGLFSCSTSSGDGAGSGGHTYTISGMVKLGGDGLPGVTVTLAGGASATTTSGATGLYSFTGLANGLYTVTPSLAGFTFIPATITATVSGANATVADIAASVTSFVAIGIAAGSRDSLAIKNDGSVWAWGYNSDGELGNGTHTDSNVPVSVSLPVGTTITAVAEGYLHSLALTSTGQVLAWGYNGDGELGNGTNTSSNVPVSVSLPQGTTITAVAASEEHSLALTSTGQVLAWGNNSNGQLGNGTNTASNVPVSVSLPVGTIITAVAAGVFHSLALTSTGQVLAWGFNGDGELGNGANTDSNVPVSVSLPVGTIITALAGGTYHSLGLTSTGQVLAWGHNAFGELGNGTNTASNVPVSVSLPVGTVITALAGGYLDSLGLTSTGQVLAWGYNLGGELGNGTYTDTNVPVSVSLPVGTTITALAGGYHHSLVITSTGQVLAWGQNGSGELGNGTYTASNVPVEVSLF